MGQGHSFPEAVEVIRERTPADVNATREYKREDGYKQYKYEDEHEMTIRVPAWVLRKILECSNKVVDHQTNAQRKASSDRVG